MQLMPATAGKTCEWLKDPNNVAESINIAAQYIKKNSAGNNTADIIAGYNGGYGTNSSSGKTPALASSKDCPGRKAYECCINAAGLKETQDYVVKVWNYSASRQ
jgi:soluble lytic murein transglycosylase-like protein